MSLSEADLEGPLQGASLKRREAPREGGGYPLLQVGVRGPLPGKFFEKWMQMVHSEPIFFCRFRVDFCPKIVCNF